MINKLESGNSMTRTLKRVFTLEIILLFIIALINFWNAQLWPSSETRLANLVQLETTYNVRPVRYPQLEDGTMCGARDVYYQNIGEQTVNQIDVLHFSDYLNEYAKLHRRILAGELPLRIIRLVCPPDNLPCEGWGDRLKAIFNLMVIGMITKRAFVLGNAANLTPDSTLDKFYGNPEFLDWSRVIPLNGTYRLNCFRSSNFECLSKPIQNGLLDKHEVVDLTSNMDHSFWVAQVFPDFLKETRMDKIPFWKSMVMQRFFPTTSLLEETVTKIIPSIPTMGMHIRTGWIKNDAARHRGDLPKLINDYVSCVSKLCFGETFPLFVTTDHQGAMDMLIHKLRKIGVYHIITAEGMGELGHNSRDPGHANLALRLMVEFEVLRRVPLIMVANSGFSLMAHRVRYHPQAIAITGKSCHRISTQHEGFYFSVSHW